MELTAEQTKKALECCVKHHCDWSNCPSYIGKGTVGCVKRVNKGALDYINRLEAENSRLQAQIEALQAECSILKQKRVNIFERIEIVEKSRADAIKEFAERFLKKVHDNHYLLSDRKNSKDHGMFTVGIEQAVNETKKEMAGKTE